MSKLIHCSEDPSSKVYNYIGYTTEYFDLKQQKTLGHTISEYRNEDDRLGGEGMKDFILTHDIELINCGKPVFVRASLQKPIRCRVKIDPICGRLKKR